MLVVILNRKRFLGKDPQDFIILRKIVEHNRKCTSFNYLNKRLVIGNVDGQRDGQLLGILSRKHPEGIRQTMFNLWT
jgi:hypothetical protein